MPKPSPWKDAITRMACKVLFRAKQPVSRGACPHCGDPAWIEPPAKSHVCADHDPWTQAERDEWRATTRKLYPATKFAPSSRELGDRFGERNRLDRERERRG